MRKSFKSIDDKDIFFLIVDDVANMRRTLKNMLKYIGYKNFVEAENGKIALARLAIHPVNFIITDINMPVMNGIEFIKKLKEHKEYKFIPIIVISGETEKDTIAGAAELNVDEYLIKPFLVTTLEKKIKFVIDTIINEKRASTHFRKGMIALEAKKYHDALDSFKTALKIEPNLTKAYGGMAKVFIENKQYDKAEQVLDEALKNNEKYIEGYQLLGEIYATKKEYNKAIKYFEKAHSLSPKNVDRIINIGQLNMEAGYNEKAEEYFEKALKISKDNPEIKVKIADTYLKNKDYDKAIEIYDKVAIENPNFLVVYNRLGIAYRKQNKYDEAIETYKKALHFGGEDEHVYYNLARTYYEKGDIKHAIENMEKALELNPAFSDAEEALDFFKKKLKSNN